PRPEREPVGKPHGRARHAAATRVERNGHQRAGEADVYELAVDHAERRAAGDIENLGLAVGQRGHAEARGGEADVYELAVERADGRAAGEIENPGLAAGQRGHAEARGGEADVYELAVDHAERRAAGDIDG